MVLFAIENLAVLLLLLVCAAGAGTLVLPREDLALRCALGLAVCAHALFVLALLGQLRAVPILLLMLVAAWRAFRVPRPAFHPLAALAALPLFVLALYPALAFDETLYHMPFVRAYARDGAITFLQDIRFPVFPVLHELLCVPAFLLAGDSGAHVVSFVQLIIVIALLVSWARRYDARAGWLAAALFVGSPLVVQLATVLYVDIALTMLVVAAFYALDRERDLLAAFLLGTACSVKYLGFFFVAVAFVFLLVRRRRAAIPFALVCAAAALPMTLWIFLHTGDPLFPFVRESVWKLPPTEPVLPLRVLWDVTFARDRIGLQPPVTPLLIGLVLVVIAAARRNVAARWVACVAAVDLAIFTFLPQDPRYLLPMLAMVCLVSAIAIATRWPRMVAIMTIVAVAPGLAYAGYRIARQGVPPVTQEQRHEWLARRIPAYEAVRRAGAEPVYACGAAQLEVYADGGLLGDYNGPHSYVRVLTGAGTTRHLAERMRRAGARYFLVAKAVCAPPRVDGGMELVYEDAAAQLWRVP